MVLVTKAQVFFWWMKLLIANLFTAILKTVSFLLITTAPHLFDLYGTQLLHTLLWAVYELKLAKFEDNNLAIKKEKRKPQNKNKILTVSGSLIC